MQKTPLYRSNRTALALMAMASSMPAVVSGGEGGSMSALAHREMIRRQDAVAEADKLVLEGREAYAKGDFETAVAKYNQALDRLPDAPMVADRRESYIAHLGDANVALAIHHRKVGKYTEARVLLEKVISVDPANPAANREIGFLDDPIRTNPALTYEHTQNIDKVRRGLYMAEGFYNLGKYDEAKREYENVLRIDKYNSAARRGMEQVAVSKSDYFRAAYDQTRAELLKDVDSAWELAVPAEMPILNDEDYGAGKVSSGVAYITEKLRTIIIPRVDFEDTTVEEAIEFLRQRATELDPAKEGVNFVIRRPRPGAGGGAAPLSADAGLDPAIGGDPGLTPATADPGSLRVKELRIRNVPLAVALKYICEQTKLRYKVDDFAVTLVPQTESGDELFTRSFRVPPDFSASLNSGSDGGAAAEADPFAPAAGAASATRLQPRPPIIDLLKQNGITFGDGTSATLTPSGALLVTNTSGELDKMEQLVNSFVSGKPKQVKITTKFVEISQENNDELGFDWIINPFGLNADTVFAGGGTTGNQGGRTGGDFVSPVNGTSVDGVPADPAQFTSGGVTNGLRSGDQAINRNNIDAILNNPNRTSQTANVAPGILSLTGLFTDGQVQMIMRGLAQKKGTDLMTAPSVTAKSGQKATIEIIREFIYPTEYEPPELPNSVGQTQQNQPVIGVGGGGGSFPVTPATPTAFDTRNTGVTLEIEPTIGDNDFVIDLRFVPEIVEFEGFINYGSPIQSPGTDALGNPVVSIITENRIEMPVFSSRRVNTSLTIYDGYTVAVGGLMREDVQNVEDKVPILGDIPIIGRLFQSKAENRIKSNLIIFVTAQIIDATGRPLKGADAGAMLPVSTAPIGGPLLLPDLALPN